MKLHRILIKATGIFALVAVFISPVSGADDGKPCYYNSFRNVRHCTNCHVDYKPTVKKHDLGSLSKVPPNIKNDPDFIKSGAPALFSGDRSAWTIDSSNVERNHGTTDNVGLFGVVAETAETAGTGNTSLFGGTINNSQNNTPVSGVSNNSSSNSNTSNNNSDGYNVGANNGYNEIRYVLARGDSIREVVSDIAAYELKQRGVKGNMTETELDEMESLVRRYNQLRWSFGDPVVGDILAVPVPAIDALAASKKQSENQSGSANGVSAENGESSYDLTATSGMTSEAFDSIFNGGGNTNNSALVNDNSASDNTVSSNITNGNSAGDNSNSNTSGSQQTAGGLDETLPLSATPEQLSLAGKKELTELDKILSDTLKGDLDNHIETDDGSSMTSYYMGQDEMNKIKYAVGGFIDNGNRSAMRCSGATYDRISRIREAIDSLGEPLARDVHVFGFGAEPSETKLEAKQAAKERIAELKAALKDLKSAM